MNVLSIINFIGFPALTIIFYYYFIKELSEAIKKTTWEESRKRRTIINLIAGLILWATFSSALSLSGFTQRFDLFPLNAAPLMMLPLGISFILIFSKGGKSVIEQINLKKITAIQSFRIPVELILWGLLIENLIPIQMTFEGRNFDIFSGLLGLVFAWLMTNNKPVMIIYNIIGLALLINIVSVAILSMPTQFQVFTNAPANTIVMKLPYLFLPTFLVPLAYIIHFVSLRKLFLKS